MNGLHAYLDCQTDFPPVNFSQKKGTAKHVVYEEANPKVYMQEIKLLQQKRAECTLMWTLFYSSKTNKFFISVIRHIRQDVRKRIDNFHQICKKCSTFLRIKFQVLKPSSRPRELWHSQVAKHLNYLIHNRLLVSISHGLVLSIEQLVDCVVYRERFSTLNLPH